MPDSQAHGSDWVRAWIDQQREQLRRMGEGASGPIFTGQMQDFAGRWLAVVQAYLRGLAQFAQSQQPDAQAAAAVSSGLNDEIVSAWQGAWAGANAAGRETSQLFSDVLGRLPPLGIAREHTEAWRELAAAQRECQELEQALRVELARVQQEALALLEQRIRERELAHKPIGAWREVYDLWVECGEQAYALVAHSDAYGKLQAELGNATVRVRARQQTILEHALKQFDLPTRSELNTLHRQMRELREKVAALEARPADRGQPTGES